MKSKNMFRSVGNIMLDMEPLLFELHIDQDLQHGEVISLISGWQHIHVPQQIETYEDGTHPGLYYYGPKMTKIKKKKNKKK